MAQTAPKPASLDVRIRFMGDLPAVVGQRTMELTLAGGHTVDDLFAALAERYGEAFTARVFSAPGKLHHYMLVFVDGEDIRDGEGFATPLGHGEVEVIMLPMFGGG